MQNSISSGLASTNLPVVAIGASAGGLEACKAMLGNIPGDFPAAAILILHLDPTHDSMAVDLLQSHTTLQVVQAVDGMKLLQGVLHVIPPGFFMTLSGQTIHLTKPEDGQAVRFPFDVLLQSLAKEKNVPTACVILSGTGTDGSQGIADLHAAGGLVIAQDPEDAGSSGMPESAIRTGYVSRTLRADQIASALTDFFHSVPSGQNDTNNHSNLHENSDIHAPRENEYDALIAYLKEHTAQDISHYKREMLERRIARRMALLSIRSTDKMRYLDILQSDAEERRHLLNDLFNHVTRFFRDPEVFEHLLTKAIPKLLAALPPGQPLRIWVAGCSTGEEVYSLAITCLEAKEAMGSDAKLQIFASDINPNAIVTARAGLYSKDIEASVTKERLEEYFVREEKGWRVSPDLRDFIVFTVADVLTDPPFSKIDLLSCRNLLIYLEPDAQQFVMARCCFALRPDGFLLLGSAEAPAHNNQCFVVEDQNAKLWRRVAHSHQGERHSAITHRDAGRLPPAPKVGSRNRLADLCRRAVLDKYGPASILLDGQLDCLYSLGPTDKYLKLSAGLGDRGILGMLPEIMRAKFRAAVASCTPDNPLVTLPGWYRTSQNFHIALHAIPEDTGHLVLVCFLDTPHANQPNAPKAFIEEKAGLENSFAAELEATRHNLQEALRHLELEIEAHDADAAEALLRSEEFQSVNEELMASQEELQSLNEELTALNDQLQETLERNRRTANDLQNVLYSTDVATLFLDLELKIRLFTPAAQKIFHVIPNDIGRPLSDLAAVAQDVDLDADAGVVLTTSEPIEREVVVGDNTWFLRRIQPYLCDARRVGGIVITYIDITERVRTAKALMAAMAAASEATKAKSRFLASASHDLRQPLQSMVLLHKLLMQNKKPGDVKRLGALQEQTLGSMTAMLDSLLDLNRIESGIVKPNIRPMHIAPLIERLVEDFNPQCSLKGLMLRSVPCKAWVMSDPQLLEQILRNFLSNALKYTRRGRILLGCRRKGAMLTFYVCDSGVGVAEKETQAIFEAYHQVENDSATYGQGLGLGLSIVKQLAHLMDHPVSVRSVPGKGSAFMIDLPVTKAPPEAVESVRIVPAEPPRQTGAVLLVEDDDTLRELLAEILEKDGHTVIAKASAQDALVWASEDGRRPDLLLTDFDLKGATTGLSLADDLLQVLGVTVPTIILTGDITGTTLRNIAASTYHQIMKPVMPDALLAAISRLLLNARTQQSHATEHVDASKISVHIIDDDPMIRETIRHLFEAEGWQVQTYVSAEAFLETPTPQGNACLLVDNVLPGMDGVALIKHLRIKKIKIPAVVLTGQGDAATAVAALKAGAHNLIEKPASASDLTESVRRALDTVARLDVHPEMLDAAEARFADLTRREHDVLRRVLGGAPNKIIAADLDISQRTVENHRASVMRKVGAKSLPELVRLALAANLKIE